MRTKILAAVLVVGLTGDARTDSAAVYTNPVLAGDYPDPSIIRVGKDYWATATSSEWGPQFPILHSPDLVNWKIVGPVFPKRPAWAVANFWAPEISEYQGRYFIYYVGRKKDGPLSVAVATADKPEGPYTDHGPLVSQEDGSIDPMAVTVEKDERWLIWKEDGNSRKRPTIIWAQQLSGDGTKLVGEMRELIRNDVPWEGAVVEGPFVLRRRDWFYLFYSGSGCCGRGCAYALGVARSRALPGPWEKNPANPILSGNEHWKCPGHGSIVTDERRRHFLLYHAYDVETFVYTGREMLLDEVKFGDDGWPTINDGKGPSAVAPSPLGITQTQKEYSFFDDFTSEHLGAGWQWPQANEPSIRLDAANGGQLVLAPTSEHASDMVGAVVARSTTSGDYEATTVVDARGLKLGAFAGLSAFGDPANGLGLAVGEGKAIVWQREKNHSKTVAEMDGVIWPSVYLRLTARGGNRFQFAVSSDGRDWKPVGETAEGGYLPPWDRSVRVALTVGGVVGAEARFNSFRIESSARGIEAQK
ncbi:MAG: xylosidase [Verrucomicrobia bacterium]|nr:MAG: xylosidase [Verrucomicrobiota bacterium]